MTQTGATLSASYMGVSGGTIFESGFEYRESGTSNWQKIYYNDALTTASGRFAVAVSSLKAGTTYEYRAWMQVGDRDFYGSMRTFATEAAGSGTGDAAAYAASWLGHYEVPATDVRLSAGQAYHSRVSETNGSGYAYVYNPSSTASTQRIVTHTFAYDGKELCNYSLLVDSRYRCALWAAWEMSRTDHPDNGVGRNQSFKPDPAVPEDWQMSGSYSNSTYNRGHQVASNDRQTTVDENKQTFYYSNMTPQNASFNSGAWASLEANVQGLLGQLGSRQKVYVVTGPVFESGYGTTTDSAGRSCAIPSKYFKCVMRLTFDASGNVTAAEGAGYWLANQSGATRNVATIDAIEAMAGFDFFANVPDALEASAEASVTSFF